MSISRRLASAVGVVAFLVLAPASPAAVIIGNLYPGNDSTQTPNNSSGTASGITAAGNGSKGLGFTATGTYTLDGVTLRLFDDNTPSPVSDVKVNLYTRDTSNASFVGSLVATFTPTATGNLTAAAASYTFVPTVTGKQITANTSYWLILSNPASQTNVFNWANSSPTIVPTGSGGTSFAPRFGTGNSLEGGQSSNYNTYQLEGTAVPEPATASLAFTAAAVGLLRRRR